MTVSKGCFVQCAERMVNGLIIVLFVIVEVFIIKEVFDKMVKEYQRFLKLYYPAHGSNGFTERNLTFNFCHQYLNYHKNQNTKDIIVWQEIPTANPECSKRNNHFDSL